MSISNVIVMLFICLKLNLRGYLASLGRHILEWWRIEALLKKLRAGGCCFNPHSLGCCIWRDEVILLL